MQSRNRGVRKATIVQYDCEGGPLSGQQITVAEGVKYYRAQGMEPISGEIKMVFYKYALDTERNVFVYTGKG